MNMKTDTIDNDTAIEHLTQHPHGFWVRDRNGDVWVKIGPSYIRRHQFSGAVDPAELHGGFGPIEDMGLSEAPAGETLARPSVYYVAPPGWACAAIHERWSGSALVPGVDD